MLHSRAILLVLAISNVYTVILACKGCISLDEYNFDKIITRFEAVLVKFDVAYPYGEKHEAFSKLAEEVANSKDIILAQVGVKDYGEKENEDLAQKYGYSKKDDLPLIKFFKKDATNPVDFPKSSDFTIENLRNLIRDNTDIYFGLPGCLEKFDKLALDFVASKNWEHKIKDAETLSANLKDEEKSAAKMYILFMKKILDRGVSFVKQEISRLSKIIKEGKVNDKKKQELSNRLNILHSFNKISKDEL